MIMEICNEKQISLCHSERIKNLVGLLGLDFILFRILPFSCTPCRGAFGGKSTAKPPTRQHSHQTKNSYHSRITRHFRSSNKFGFCRLLVLFDCSLLAIVGFWPKSFIITLSCWTCFSISKIKHISLMWNLFY